MAKVSLHKVQINNKNMYIFPLQPICLLYIKKILNSRHYLMNVPKITVRGR